MGNNLLKSAFLIMTLTLFGRMMGLIRNMFITHQFGTTVDASSFLLAFSIPNTLFLFLPGALNAVFIPSLKGLVTNGKIHEAQNLFRKVLTITVLLYLIIGVVSWIFAGNIIDVIGGEASDQLKSTATSLLRWMIPSVLFIALLGLFSSTLNVHHYFVLPHVGTIVNNTVVIISMLIFVPFFGVTGLAIGINLGFASAVMIMLPLIFKEKYRLMPNWQWRDPELFKIAKLSIPIVLGSSITSLNEFLEKFLVSGYGDDKIAALGYARTIYQLPLAMFAGALSMQLFILMLEHFKKQDYRSAQETIERGLQYMWILMLPTTIGIIFLGEGIVKIFYERGEFTSSSTVITAQALIFLVIGLFPSAARDLLTRAFYSVDNTVIPVLVGILHIFLFVVFSHFLLPQIGFAGVALGWSLASLVTALLQGYILKRKIGGFIRKNFTRSFVKSCVASSGMAVVLYLVLLTTKSWHSYIQTMISILIGASIYLIIMVALKDSLTVELVQRIKGKLLKHK